MNGLIGTNGQRVAVTDNAVVGVIREVGTWDGEKELTDLLVRNNVTIIDTTEKENILDCLDDEEDDPTIPPVALGMVERVSTVIQLAT